MKKRIYFTISMCCLLIMLGFAFWYYGYCDTDIHKATYGSFEYEYKIQRGGNWITKITPISDEGISILEIPKWLGGKKVVKLGNEADRFVKDESPELVCGSIQDGIWKIPDNISKVYYPGFLGNISSLSKVVVPSGVTELAFDKDTGYDHNNLTYVFEGACPPQVEDGYIFENSKIYVLKGYEEVYKNAWKNVLSEDLDYSFEIIE